MLMMKIAGVALGVVLMGAPAWAQHGTAPQQGEAQSLQGDTSAWVNNAYMHQFYDLTVETLGKGATSVDFDAYRDKSYAIFRAFGVAAALFAPSSCSTASPRPSGAITRRLPCCSIRTSRRSSANRRTHGVA